MRIILPEMFTFLMIKDGVLSLVLFKPSKRQMNMSIDGTILVQFQHIKQSGKTQWRIRGWQGRVPHPYRGKCFHFHVVFDKHFLKQ